MDTDNREMVERLERDCWEAERSNRYVRVKPSDLRELLEASQLSGVVGRWQLSEAEAVCIWNTRTPAKHEAK